MAGKILIREQDVSSGRPSDLERRSDVQPLRLHFYFAMTSWPLSNTAQYLENPFRF